MNAIIINNQFFELVENTTGKDDCETCDLRVLCRNSATFICVDVHNAEVKNHYIKRPKEEKK